MKKLLTARVSFWLIILFYVGVNILFNFKFWQQLFLKEFPHRLGIFGEWPVYEYVAETVRLNFLAGHNPFSDAVDLLYPFGWNFALEDTAPINGFYFLFLRPFLTIHQSFILIVLLSIIAANITTYLLLGHLRISQKTAFVMSLVFGYTPFLITRLGHPSYLAVYLFPIFFLLLSYLTQAKKPFGKIIYAFGLGVVFTISVLTNLYYTLMIILLCLFLSLIFIIFDKKQLMNWVGSLFPGILVSAVTVVILLVPWLTKAHESIFFGRSSSSSSWIDSVTYSAGLFGILLPGSANPIYGKFIEFITSQIPFINPSFESFIYPGILILGVFVYYLFYRKKISRAAVKKVRPLFWVSIIFWILTLGPFLHVFSQKLPLPLPYAVFNIIPYLQMARSPGRFIVPFVFLAVIIAALVIDDVFKNHLKTKISKNLFFLNLMLIFFLDQSYTAVLPVPYFRVIPPTIYQYLRSTKDKNTLLEVPFVVRDGLRFEGDYHAIWLPLTQLIHRQKIFSVYGGRINDKIFDYYKNDPLFSYLSKLINNPNPQKQQIQDELKTVIERSIGFFDIEYVLLKTDEIYSETAGLLFHTLGFQQIMRDREYVLLYKELDPLTKRDLSPFKLDAKESNLYLAEGWGGVEPTGQWVIGKRARVLFKLNKIQPVKVRLTAHTLINKQKAVVYINRRKVTTIALSKAPNTYSFTINAHLLDGINRLVFQFAETIQPAQIITDNKDTRNLAAFFTDINFEKLK